MADSSDEKALDLLARIIADEIWRQLVEEARAGSDAVNDRRLGGRERPAPER